MNSKVLPLLPHMHPHIRISPFIPREWENILNKKSVASLSHITHAEYWLDGAKDVQFYESGRQSLWACLIHLNLTHEDEVLIIKTTDGTYISGCITSTIEKICHWSQTYSEKTRLVLVIHEFGFPCSPHKFLPYQKKGLPILEDCAYGFGSRLEGASVGKHGDFALYSLTKYYPIPFGGFLAAKKKITPLAKNFCIDSQRKTMMLQTMTKSHASALSWNSIRRANWNHFAKRLSPLGFKPYFSLARGVVPGVYLMRIPSDFSAEAIKKNLNVAGVEATQYYHQEGFYFPVHQFLTALEKDYLLAYFEC